ncbi:uncharacterized protein B0I36DRAFT_244966 [Microdochium trichocladiopsis]|uniref:PH domain-containing protein n=1 Tax=Microdochium trichocladiopsis TaxID=1682393 RepID=A0A9P9BPR9_9PEZI|nr:uncharacterized protein B0I36DRAFT_244966 [Microdochium trichocladiopsis]KAH7029395.1 hypothetical protein B0I36DRAFT_244966 [Microdochium trichocladiopsis]
MAARPFAPAASSRSGDYFPPQNGHDHHQPLDHDHDQQTLSNTLANTHLAAGTSTNDFSHDNPNPYITQPDAEGYLGSPSRQPKFTEEWDASVRGSSILNHPAMQRSSSVVSHRSHRSTEGSLADGQAASLSRGNTLKKKNSLRKGGGSLRRSGSRRSMKAGSVRSLALQSADDPEEANNVFHCPVPTSGNPTETLANRFQTWRKVLKDLIAYFREIQNHYEHRSKSLLKLANVLNNTSTPPGFMAAGGLDDALQILRNYHKTSIHEANKAREIEEDVILALTGLRSDLNQKMKEIRGLSGDFKNSVDKEMDNTRRAVNALSECLGQTELDPSLTTGKQDPYLLRLAVDRQVERQLDEENYLHQAYLNLETSGRELESIVVGEIQKAYNAYAGILKRESDNAYSAIEDLRGGPIGMPKDYEWSNFVQRDAQFVDPEIPIRSVDRVHYPGRDHVACQEIRAGLLERKSKYLKSYTAGWYVLSPTHLHEFKSADKTQAPVMSLYLPEQKLGSHSTQGGSSNKFILKGRQTGGMHRGHTWVFRAESHDTMMAWYEDIKALTEKTPEEISNFIRGNHARSYSRSSQRSMSSDGMVDEEDEEPFVANPAVASPGSREPHQNRPQPGGRFPSDLEVTAQRGLQVPLSPSSGSSAVLDRDNTVHHTQANGAPDHDIIAAAAAQPGSGVGDHYHGVATRQYPVGQSYGNTGSVIMDEAPSHAARIDQEAQQDGVNPYSGESFQPQSQHLASQQQQWQPPQDSSHPALLAGPISVKDHGASPQSGANSGPHELPSREGADESQQIHQDARMLGGAYTTQQTPNTASTGHSADGSWRPSSAVSVDTLTSDLSSPVRPWAGKRTDSTPHVPGEYPRSIPASTPGV